MCFSRNIDEPVNHNDLRAKVIEKAPQMLVLNTLGLTTIHSGQQNEKGQNVSPKYMRDTEISKSNEHQTRKLCIICKDIGEH